jgi:hypothetical protein
MHPLHLNAQLVLAVSLAHKNNFCWFCFCPYLFAAWVTRGELAFQFLLLPSPNDGLSVLSEEAGQRAGTMLRKRFTA